MSTEQPEQELKKCGKCGKTFPMDREHYYRSKISKTGWGSYCKPCTQQYNHNYNLKRFGRVGLSKGREVYDPQIHGDDLNQEQEMLVREAGIAPDGWYICSRCEHVKPNDIKYFPLQPGRFRTKDGERKFGIVCKTCRRKAKRHAKHRRQYEKEMAGIQWDTSIPEEYNQVEVDSRYRQKVAEHEYLYKRDPRIY